MRCIRDLVSEAGQRFAYLSPFKYDVFETRYKGDVPGIDDYDIFISSGGPGSPFEDEGSPWEKDYFKLLDSIWSYNHSVTIGKKYIFFICHSFQLMARHFQFGAVGKREKKSFGIHPFSRTADGSKDVILSQLPDPFYAADFRQYQVTQPDQRIIAQLGASILSTEMNRQNGSEPALMAVRISDEIAGTQFHPEADPASMIYHFKQQERKDFIIAEFGEEMYHTMLSYLDDPDKIQRTRKSVIPSFLDNAFQHLLEQHQQV
jgi:GMP synthase-like glutamine amidotransferase